MHMSIFFTTDITLRQYVSQFMQTQPNIPAMLNVELFMTIMKGMALFHVFPFDHCYCSYTTQFQADEKICPPPERTQTGIRPAFTKPNQSTPGIFTNFRCEQQHTISGKNASP
jgi:hypothetical protein